MRIQFLGTGAGNFRGSRRQPSSAVLEDLLLDCGAGATGRLHDAGKFGEINAVLVSHLHSDHVAGLFDLLLHTLVTGRTRPLTILSPPGLRGLIRAMVEVHGTVVDPATLYELRILEGDRLETTVGRWKIRSVPLDHTVLDVGFLLTTDGFSLFYSGDTREPSAARDVRADYLVHEATYPDRLANLAREYGHSTSSGAADAAVAMGARHLLINHVGDEPDAGSEIAREARRVFPDSVVTEDGLRLDL